jgi:hypothetical protein
MARALALLPIRRSRKPADPVDVETVIRHARPQPRPIAPDAAQRILALALAEGRMRRIRYTGLGLAAGSLGALLLTLQTQATLTPVVRYAVPPQPAAQVETGPAVNYLASVTEEGAPARKETPGARLALRTDPGRVSLRHVHRPVAAPGPVPDTETASVLPTAEPRIETEPDPVAPEFLVAAWMEEHSSYSVEVEEPSEDGARTLSSRAGAWTDDGQGGWTWYEQSVQPDRTSQRVLVTFDEETQTMGYAIVQEETARVEPRVEPVETDTEDPAP